MPKQNAIARRSTEELRLEALRRYCDFRQGRPTVASVARDMGIPYSTVRKWFSGPDIARLVSEIEPQWPDGSPADAE